jgi:hypothetical protein
MRVSTESSQGIDAGSRHFPSGIWSNLNSKSFSNNFESAIIVIFGRQVNGAIGSLVSALGITLKTVQARSGRRSISGIGFLAESERFDEEHVDIGGCGCNWAFVRLPILPLDRSLRQRG